MSKKPEFNEAMDIYYKLKNEYYEKIKEHKNSLRNDQTLTLKEKRAKFANIKPKCINCPKASGTIFLNVYSPETRMRHLIAKCGDTRNPCELSINLAVGECDVLTNYIKEIEDGIEESKKNVIKDKNNMLFGYITSDEALKLFDTYKKEITEYTEILESTLTDYTNATLNKSKLTEIKKIQGDIYANINEIKKQMATFAHTNNTQSIKNAVNIYIDNLLPLNKALIETKYKASVVEYNDTTHEYHLIQKENTINSLELCFESSVISFQISSYSKNENVANQTNTTKKKKPESEEKKQAKEDKEREKEEKKKAKEQKEREKEEKKKAESQDNEIEQEEKKNPEKEEKKKKAKEEKEREKEEKKKAKEEKEREKEEKKKAKEEKEREKEEKKKAKEEKKKNKQTGGNDDSSSFDDDTSSSSSSSSSSSEEDDSDSSSSEDEYSSHEKK